MKSQFLACLSFAKSEWRWGCMKRWLMAVAALLCLSEVTARADYFIIKVNLASTKEKAQTNNNAMAQQPGATGLMPGQGMGGLCGFGARGGMPGMSMPGMGMPVPAWVWAAEGAEAARVGVWDRPAAQAWECLAAWAVGHHGRRNSGTSGWWFCRSSRWNGFSRCRRGGFSRRRHVDGTERPPERPCRLWNHHEPDVGRR